LKRKTEMGRVEGKVALITGGASGLGSATARVLAEQGARVVITDIDVEAGARVAAGIGHEALFIQQDVASEADWERVISRVIEEYGKLDVLVNNAGILHMASIEDTSLEDWQRVHAVNSDGVFLGCKYAVAAMKGTTKNGSIINISSGAGLRPISLVPAYGASKSVVWSLTRTTALHCAESGYPIRCNSIHNDGTARRGASDEEAGDGRGRGPVHTVPGIGRVCDRYRCGIAGGWWLQHRLITCSVSGNHAVNMTQQQGTGYWCKKQDNLFILEAICKLSQAMVSNVPVK
jgi:3(or 17)beta-hydroxysteroid dehydrogenase